MALYLTQFSYNKEALAALGRNPQRLSGRLVHAVEHSLGGRILSLAFCFRFAEWDGIVLFEAPDPTRATAILMAALSASHIASSRTRTRCSRSRSSRRRCARRAGWSTRRPLPQARRLFNRQEA